MPLNTIASGHLTEPCPTTLPCFDSDGEFCTLDIELQLQWSAGQYDNEAGYLPLDYTQVNNLSELQTAVLAYLALTFQERRLVGYGEQVATTSGSSGTWRLPDNVGVG